MRVKSDFKQLKVGSNEGRFKPDLKKKKIINSISNF